MDMDLKLQIELVKALGSILSATIPTVVAYLLGRKALNNAKIKSQLQTVLTDLRFMISVEELHCREHMENDGASKKKEMRSNVSMEKGFHWSGKNTLSKISKRLAAL